MRVQKIALAFLLGMSFSVQAQDNVMVDLSVLNELSSTYIAPEEPLFPVLPKQPKVVAKKIKKTPASEKALVQTTKEVKNEDKVIVPEKETVTIPQLPAVDEEKIVVVDVEPAPEDAIAVVEQEKVPFKQEEKVSEEVPTTAPTTDIAKESLDETTQEHALLIEPEPVIDADNESDHDRTIVFADGVYELSTEQMSKIDDIIGHFGDLTTNKIAIYSYNIDDGVDTFKKKRISLNRAIEIRSYLLKQGYKNFSIKVINTDTNSDKANMVELEEI